MHKAGDPGRRGKGAPGASCGGGTRGVVGRGDTGVLGRGTGGPGGVLWPGGGRTWDSVDRVPDGVLGTQRCPGIGGGGPGGVVWIRRRGLARNLCGFTDAIGVICRRRQGNFDIIKHAHVIYTKDQKSLFLYNIIFYD